MQQEISIHRRLRHPSLLSLLESFEDSAFYYLVTEYCSRGELFAFLAQRGEPLSEWETRAFFRQVVDGLYYLHSHGVIHRDMKLSNVLLTDSFAVKIADFGLAVQLDAAGDEQRTICGTPNYLSPEVVLRQPYGLSTDVWSLGCLLFHFLVGRPPFESASVPDTLAKIRRGDYSIPPTVPPSAADLIRRLLTVDARARPTLADVLAHPFLAAAPTNVTENPPLPTLKRERLCPTRAVFDCGVVELFADGAVELALDVDPFTMRVCSSGDTVTIMERRFDGANAAQRTFPLTLLPPKLHKRYAVLARFVASLRAQTPKVTHAARFYSTTLMEAGNIVVRGAHGGPFEGCSITMTSANAVVADVCLPGKAAVSMAVDADAPISRDLLRAAVQSAKLCAYIETALADDDQCATFSLLSVMFLLIRCKIVPCRAWRIDINSRNFPRFCRRRRRFPSWRRMVRRDAEWRVPHDDAGWRADECRCR